jgi:hypothetical protein
VPRPFHGALVWAGKQLRPLARSFRWLARQVPGGAIVLWLLLAALVVLASAGFAAQTATRRGGRWVERAARDGPGRRIDPAVLERQADEAEAGARWADALRLRFRAGLLRLGRAKVVPLRDSLTSGEARRALRLADFDTLARTHDEVVFGGRAASGDDAAASRTGWRRVLEQTGVGS